jgi:hypothetical protein
MNRFVCLLTLASACCALSCAGGCRGNAVDRYEPASATARQAIDSALSKWKAGTRHGPITDATPNLNVFDARWQAGAKLERYEILDEVSGKQHPQFRVKLKLVGKPEETTDYLVFGIDPPLVFREADYAKAGGM